MVAVGKDHLGAGLQANAALVFPLGVLVIGVKLPAAAAVAVPLAPPLLLAVSRHDVLLNLLQVGVYYGCIPWHVRKKHTVSVHEEGLKLKNFPQLCACYAYSRIL